MQQMGSCKSLIQILFLFLFFDLIDAFNTETVSYFGK